MSSVRPAARRLSTRAAMSSVDAETDVLVQSVMAAVLESSTTDIGLVVVSGAYYALAARHVVQHDPELLTRIRDLATFVRSKYRTAAEHGQHLARVECTRTVDDRTKHALDDDCALCLKPLRGPRQLARLQASSRDPKECGHFFHASCVATWELHRQHGENLACPVCRADVGAIVQTWLDHEATEPRF